MALSFKEFRLRYSVTEEKDPCWKGYTQLGMKKKGKKQVPNCVKEEEHTHGR